MTQSYGQREELKKRKEKRKKNKKNKGFGGKTLEPGLRCYIVVVWFGLVRWGGKKFKNAKELDLKANPGFEPGLSEISLVSDLLTSSKSDVLTARLIGHWILIRYSRSLIPYI
jgi:hypothetical protein